MSKMAKTSKEALESVTVEISTDGDASTQSVPCSQSQDSIIGTSPVHCGNSSQPHASGMTSGGSTRALSVSKGSPEDAAAPEDPAAAEDGCLGRNESPNLSMSRSAKPQGSVVSFDLESGAPQGSVVSFDVNTPEGTAPANGAAHGAQRSVGRVSRVAVEDLDPRPGRGQSMVFVVPLDERSLASSSSTDEESASKPPVGMLMQLGHSFVGFFRKWWHDLDVSRRRSHFAIGLIFLLSGAASGAMAAGFQVASDQAQSLQRSWFATTPYLAWLIIPLGLTGTQALVRLAFDGTAGSGIPLEMASFILIDGDPNIIRIFSLRILVGKFGLTLLGQLCGASSGREGCACTPPRVICPARSALQPLRSAAPPLCSSSAPQPSHVCTPTLARCVWLAQPDGAGVLGADPLLPQVCGPAATARA